MGAVQEAAQGSQLTQPRITSQGRFGAPFFWRNRFRLNPSRARA